MIKLCTWVLANSAEYPNLHRSHSIIGQSFRTKVSRTQYNPPMCPENSAVKCGTIMLSNHFVLKNLPFVLKKPPFHHVKKFTAAKQEKPHVPCLKLSSSVKCAKMMVSNRSVLKKTSLLY